MPDEAKSVEYVKYCTCINECFAKNVWSKAACMLIKDYWELSIVHTFVLIAESYNKLNYYDQKIKQALRVTYGTTGQLFRPY